VGFKNRISTLLSWMLTFTSNGRGQLATTSQWVYGRLAIGIIEKQLEESIGDDEERADALDNSLGAALSREHQR
jgi:NADH dehydrogenase